VALAPRQQAPPGINRRAAETTAGTENKTDADPADIEIGGTERKLEFWKRHHDKHHG